MSIKLYTTFFISISGLFIQPFVTIQRVLGLFGLLIISQLRFDGMNEFAQVEIFGVILNELLHGQQCLPCKIGLQLSQMIFTFHQQLSNLMQLFE